MGLLFIDNGGHKLVAIYDQSISLIDSVYAWSWSRGIQSLIRPDAPQAPQSVSASSSSSPKMVTSINCVGIDCDGNRHVGNALLGLQQYNDLILRRPVERGFIVDFALQAHIWLHGVIEPLQVVDEASTDVVLSIPYGMPDEVCEGIEYMCFKQFNFRSVTLIGSAFLNLLGRRVSSQWGATAVSEEGAGTKKAGSKRLREEGTNAACATEGVNYAAPSHMTGIVVDAGFSGTTVVPFIWGRVVREAVVYLGVGGKHLTNMLKQIISFSQMDLLGDTWLCNEIKERCCYVSPCFDATMIGYVQWKRLPHFTRKEILQSSMNGTTAAEPPGHTCVWPPLVQQYLLPTAGPTRPLGRLIPPAHTPQAAALKQLLRPHKHLLQHVVLKQEAMVIGEMIFSPGVVLGGGAMSAGAQLGLTDILVRGLWLDSSRKQTSPLYHAPRALREELLANVVLCGGTASNLPGFEERVINDLRTAISQPGVTEFVPPAKCTGVQTTNKCVSPPMEGDERGAPAFLVAGALALFFTPKSSSASSAAASMIGHAYTTLQQQAKIHTHASGSQHLPPTTVEKVKCSRESFRFAAAFMM